MLTKDDIKQGKSYRIRYKQFPERLNAKISEARVQILDIRDSYDRTTITTNRRPWNEGGTGSLYLNQIESVEEIERPSN